MHKEKVFLCYRNQEKILGKVFFTAVRCGPPGGKAVLDVPPHVSGALSCAGKGTAVPLPAFSSVALPQFK